MSEETSAQMTEKVEKTKNADMRVCNEEATNLVSQVFNNIRLTGMKYKNNEAAEVVGSNTLKELTMIMLKS